MYTVLYLSDTLLEQAILLIGMCRCKSMQNTYYQIKH